MKIVMHDLVGQDDRRFSPWCWATKMSLAHKGLTYETRPTPFTAIADLPGDTAKTLPTIEHENNVVSDSLAIGEYLEQHFDGPTLFGGPGGIAGARFFQMWVGTTLVPQIARLVLLDIYDRVLPEDQAYFRASREQRFGMPLEQVQQGREQRLEPFRESLIPARLLLRKQAFLGGEQPQYADYQMFGRIAMGSRNQRLSIAGR